MVLRRHLLFVGFALAVVTGSGSALPFIASRATAAVGATSGRAAAQVRTVESGTEPDWTVARIVPSSPRD
ncbi:hypothetical protein [Streptomyces sp. AC627_RSS907]|uniref:hypothetical protein n=1 Tax=Streptomyces sp. AC627_RSS907 TaxID=2823684 RepID=UPI001C231B05|nr:hypothetical protein [Streptomyces sp. AC627_RSS907]